MKTRIYSVLVENRSGVLCKVAGLFSRRCFNIDSLDVIKVNTYAERQCIAREMMLIKIKYNKNNRREIMELCEIMKVDIVDMSRHYMMLQICDTPERVKLLIDMLHTVSIVEVARTGTVALAKCCENDEG